MQKCLENTAMEFRGVTPDKLPESLCHSDQPVLGSISFKTDVIAFLVEFNCPHVA